MKKILLIVTVLMALLLAACTSAEQKAYESALQQAKDKITAEEFDAAEEQLTKALSAGYDESLEAQSLLDQLQTYKSLEGLLNEGKFEEVYESVDALSSIENGSEVISTKAKEFKTVAEQQQQQFNELQAIVDESLKLAEEGNFKGSSESLQAIDLTKYNEPYFEAMKATITETIASNDQSIAAIKAEEERKAEEARKKAEAEKKRKEELARKSNMLNWTYEEIDRYIANYFQLNINHVIVEVYDRSSSGYQIDVRHDNAAAGKGDPGVAPALGFFEVRSDGKLYKMDILSGDYVLVN